MFFGSYFARRFRHDNTKSSDSNCQNKVTNSSLPTYSCRCQSIWLAYITHMVRSVFVLGQPRFASPVQEPWTRVVRDKTECHVVVVCLYASRYCVPPHRVDEVIRTTTRHSDHVENMLSSCISWIYDAASGGTTYAMEMERMLVIHSYC